MSRSYVWAEVYHPAQPSCLMNKKLCVRVQTGALLRSQIMTNIQMVPSQTKETKKRQL